MSKLSFCGLVVAATAAAVVSLVSCGGPQEGRGGNQRAATLPSGNGLLSGYFTENAGQVANEDVLLHGRVAGLQVGFAQGAVLLKVSGESPGAPEPLGHTLSRSARPATRKAVLVRIAFDGAQPVLPVGRSPRAHGSNYLLGEDASKWRTDLRSFEEVVYPNLYEGIDLIYRATERGLKYELEVRPGADLERFSLRYEGVDGLGIAPDGDLLIHTAIGDLRDEAPRAWQGSREVVAEFDLRGGGVCGIRCDDWDGAEPLFIDPLTWSTFEGGADDDMGADIKVHGDGSVFVTGVTRSGGFPATPGAYEESLEGISDAFVLKLEPGGSALVWATFLGGDSVDEGHGIDVDDNGRAFVTGETRGGFPTTGNAFDDTYNGGQGIGGDAFVAILDPTGSVLEYSTYFGGTKADTGNGIVVDSSGRFTIAGVTRSDDIPRFLLAYDSTYNGGLTDAFVAQFHATGAIQSSTYIGGDDEDGAFDIAVDASKEVYITGVTHSGNFPRTPSPFDNTFGGANEGFAARFPLGLVTTTFSTFLGGEETDGGWGIDVGPKGHVYITGRTTSPSFPVGLAGFDSTFAGGSSFPDSDAFVLKLDAMGQNRIWGSFLGDTGEDWGTNIVVNGSDEAFVVGRTASSKFPTTLHAYDETHNGGQDVFITRFHSSGSVLLHSTFLGAASDETGFGIDLDPAGCVAVTGWTTSLNFPTTGGADDTSWNGGQDAFVTSLCLNPLRFCPAGFGFWRKRQVIWPFDRTDMGAESYSKDELMEIFQMPPRGDASLILARQLIPAKLNMAIGIDGGPIAAEMAETDRLLRSIGGRLPLGAHASSAEGQRLLDIKDVLEQFNDGHLTAGCGP